MRARIGIWHDEVAVFFDHDPVVPIAVSLEPDTRKLFITEEGECGVRAYHDPCDDTRVGFEWRVDVMGCEREGFSRCSLMEVDLVPCAGGWSADLPANHMMPWPHARDCKSYNRKEELMRECLVRRDSARAAGERMPPPPPCIQGELTPAMRVALFS